MKADALLQSASNLDESTEKKLGYATEQCCLNFPSLRNVSLLRHCQNLKLSVSKQSQSTMSKKENSSPTKKCQKENKAIISSTKNKCFSERQFKSLSMCAFNQTQTFFNNAPLAKPESFSDIYNDHSYTSPNRFGIFYEKLAQHNYAVENETNNNKNLSINEDVYYDDSINIKNPIFNLQLEKLPNKYSNIKARNDEESDEQGVKSSLVWWPYNQDIESSSSNFIDNNSKSKLFKKLLEQKSKFKRLLY